MMYRGKHAKPLINWRRLGEYLAMMAVEMVFVWVIVLIWLNSPI